MAKKKTDNTIASEAGLPPSWAPINVAPIVPGSGAPPTNENKRGGLYGGSISPDLQHPANFQDTGVQNPYIPTLPLMALVASGSPGGNSAINSGTSGIAAQANAAS